MEELNIKTKKAKGYVNAYLYRLDRCNRLGIYRDSIYSVYDKPSDSKISAFEYCKEISKKLWGYNNLIISYNGWMFTFGFTYVDDDGFVHIVYITKEHDYDINLCVKDIKEYIKTMEV